MSRCKLVLFVRCPFVLMLAMGFDLGAAVGSEFESYRLIETFNFPIIAEPEDQGAVVFDNLSDGRLLALSTLVTDRENFLGTPRLYLESDVGSREFDALGDLPLPPGGRWNSGGGAFLRVSDGVPGGARIAFGNNDFISPQVGILSEADLLTSAIEDLPIDWFDVPHFSAAWADDRQLAINHGDFTSSRVSLLDVESDPSDPLFRLLVEGIRGASGGVGFDSLGNLVTANGAEDAQPGGSQTGDIRAFEFADWQSAVVEEETLAFESQGTLIDTILSGGSLLFDREDNLLVGGSDFVASGQSDFFALVPGPGLGSETRIFDPDEVSKSFYVLFQNEVTREFYANEPFPLEFGESTDNTLVYVYRSRLLGDLDGDGDVDFDDIDALVLGLTNSPSYELEFGVTPELAGDTDHDGDFDFDDIPGFVDLLFRVETAGSRAALGRSVPEPSAASLAVIGGALWFLRRRRPYGDLMKPVPQSFNRALEEPAAGRIHCK